MPRRSMSSFFAFFLNKLNLILAFCFGLLVSHIMYKPPCSSLSVPENSFFVVILIISSPENIDRRNAIRETWLNLRPRIINNSFYNSEVLFLPRVSELGDVVQETVADQQRFLKSYQKWMNLKTKNIKVGDYKVKHFFAIGTKNLDRKVAEAVRAEQQVFSDLLLFPDLVDSYGNLTEKLLLSISAIHDEVDFNYLLKCDDDSYVRLDTLSQDLLDYHKKLSQYSRYNISLYWGYFNGRANIKNSGKWKEQNYTICDKYLPYALGGGYVISQSLTKFISQHRSDLRSFLSEDVSMGTWLTPFRNIHRRHDVRFDTGYIPRPSKDYHMVLHKIYPREMHKLYKGASNSNVQDTTERRQLYEYFYDWYQLPSKCCDNLV